MKRDWLVITGVAILIIVGACSELSVWNECRADHSWLYCSRVLNK